MHRSVLVHDVVERTRLVRANRFDLLPSRKKNARHLVSRTIPGSNGKTTDVVRNQSLLFGGPSTHLTVLREDNPTALAHIREPHVVAIFVIQEEVVIQGNSIDTMCAQRCAHLVATKTTVA